MAVAFPGQIKLPHAKIRVSPIDDAHFSFDNDNGDGRLVSLERRILARTPKVFLGHGRWEMKRHAGIEGNFGLILTYFHTTVWTTCICYQ